MMLPSLVLPSWNAFLNQVDQLGCGSPIRPSYVFRGQADSQWRMLPSLARYLAGVTNEKAVDALEDQLEREFFAQAHPYSSLATAIRHGDAAWTERLALMQHHGVPTRLLDWTISPMVAAYFACANESSRDGAVFVAHPLSVGTHVRTTLGYDPSSSGLEQRVAGSPPVISFFRSDSRSDRQVTQQGHFSMATDPLVAHDELLAAALRPGVGPSGPDVVAAKWIVPAGMKLTFLNQLRQLNVAGHSLFPGLDGLGRSLSEAAMIEGALLRSSNAVELHAAADSESVVCALRALSRFAAAELRARAT